MGRRWMGIQVYVLPVPITLACAWLWWRWSGSDVFAAYATLLPVAYGYIVPGIGTNLLKKWRFHGPGRIGNYYLHHGFVWAANLGPALLVSFLGTPDGPLSVATMVRVLLCGGALHAYKGWVYDIGLLRHGFAEVTNIPALAHRSAEEVAGAYVPLLFFLVGLAYAAGALVAYHLFLVQHRGDLAAHLLAWAVGGIGMAALPSLGWLLIAPNDPDPKI